MIFSSLLRRRLLASALSHPKAERTHIGLWPQHNTLTYSVAPCHRCPPRYHLHTLHSTLYTTPNSCGDILPYPADQQYSDIWISYTRRYCQLWHDLSISSMRDNAFFHVSRTRAKNNINSSPGTRSRTAVCIPPPFAVHDTVPH